MSAGALDPVRPGQGDVDAAVAALPRVRGYLSRPSGSESVRLRVDDVDGEDGGEVVVPRAAVEVLARVLAHMAHGDGVSVVPAAAEVTTQQAADLLNVSRPFLIGLLEDGQIDFRRVGRHRRVRLESLLAYMGEDDRRRRDAADELTVLTQDIGGLL
jgi:excisionase family DNA binding protein